MKFISFLFCIFFYSVPLVFIDYYVHTFPYFIIFYFIFILYVWILCFCFMSIGKIKWKIKKTKKKYGRQIFMHKTTVYCSKIKMLKIFQLWKMKQLVTTLIKVGVFLSVFLSLLINFYFTSFFFKRNEKTKKVQFSDHWIELSKRNIWLILLWQHIEI